MSPRGAAVLAGVDQLAVLAEEDAEECISFLQPARKKITTVMAVRVFFIKVVETTIKRRLLLFVCIKHGVEKSCEYILQGTI